MSMETFNGDGWYNHTKTGRFQQDGRLDLVRIPQESPPKDRGEQNGMNIYTQTEKTA